MKQFHIRRECGQWTYYKHLNGGLGMLKQGVSMGVCLHYTPVVRAAEWSDFKILVANWRKNHGY